MRAFLLALALLPLAAAASVEEHPYVAGTGIPNGFAGCAGGREMVNGIAPPFVGAACTIPVEVGATLTIEVFDDVRGSTGFWWEIRPAFPATDCGGGRGFASGPLVRSVPPGCVHLTVAPQVGSLSGVVRIAS